LFNYLNYYKGYKQIYFIGAPFRGPRIGDNLTEEDYRRAEARFRCKVSEMKRQGRNTITQEEYENSNGCCNVGAMSYSTRYRILREFEVGLPD